MERLSRRVVGPYANLDRPDHIAPFVDLFERIQAGETVFAVADTPPQHGKTAVELYGAVRYLLNKPQYSVVYASYGAEFSNERSRDARMIAEAAGMRLMTDKVTHWRTSGGGSFIATSVAGPLTGEPSIKLIIVDDPFKDRATAESKVERDKINAWFSGSVLSRAHPDTSIIVCHTRWHTDDLIGRLKLASRELTPEELAQGLSPGKRYEHVHLPALNERGEGLWPARRPLAWYHQRLKDNEYDWWSMFMGEPRPRGGAVFGDVTLYDALPSFYRVAIGVDLAYTAKTYADYSVAVVLATAPDPNDPEQQLFYVLDVVRLQVQAPTFAERLKLLSETYPGARMMAYAYGTEMGNISWLRKEGVRIIGKSMTGDKFVRAQPVAAAWKHGRVLLPRTRGAVDPTLPEGEARRAPEWLNDFIGEVAVFTGISDPNDDQVDALAPAYDLLARKKKQDDGGSGVVVAGTPLEDRPVGL
jgi:phage terminase large subunit-like protein